MNVMFLTMYLAAASVADSILEVFTTIGNWIVTFIPSLMPIFYNAETGLTILGVLAVCSLALGACLLFLGIVQKFFHWRG